MNEDSSKMVAMIPKDNCATLYRLGANTTMKPKKRKRQYYMFLVTYDGYDQNKSPHENENLCWIFEELQTSLDVYELIVNFHKKIQQEG